MFLIHPFEDVLLIGDGVGFSVLANNGQTGDWTADPLLNGKDCSRWKNEESVVLLQRQDFSEMLLNFKVESVVPIIYLSNQFALSMKCVFVVCKE